MYILCDICGNPLEKPKTMKGPNGLSVCQKCQKAKAKLKKEAKKSHERTRKD